MTDPITREQVERAIDAAYDCNAQGVNAALGAFWYEREDIPADVRDGWRQVGYLGLRIALTRWHAELVAAERECRVARFDPKSGRYVLTPPYKQHPHSDASIAGRPVAHVAGKQQAIAWGYTIEGAMLEAIDAQRQPDPQPDLAEGWRVVTGDTAFAMPFGTIRECSGCGCLVSGGPTACRRCADAPGPQPGPEAPTRPEPRYKVGDWVRWNTIVFQVANVAWTWDRWTCTDGQGYGGGEDTLTTALDPALHETARRTVAILRKGEWPLDVERRARVRAQADRWRTRRLAGVHELPGFKAWDTGELRTPEWAAQLERLLGDAP